MFIVNYAGIRLYQFTQYTVSVSLRAKTVLTAVFSHRFLINNYQKIRPNKRAYFELLRRALACGRGFFCHSGKKRAYYAVLANFRQMLVSRSNLGNFQYTSILVYQYTSILVVTLKGIPQNQKNPKNFKKFKKIQNPKNPKKLKKDLKIKK